MNGTASEKNKKIVIVGAGLGGLSAAIHLRLAGYEVEIYEANERVGGRANLIEAGGFRFDTGPSLLNYPWVFEDLFRAANRRMNDYIELLSVEPSVSFQWRDGTQLSLSSNLQVLIAEFERLEPGSTPRLLAFLRDAATKYELSFDKLVTRNEENYVRWLGALTLGEMVKTGVWRSLDGELKRFFKSHYIREALGSYGMYLGGSPFDLPGLFSILAYGEIAYGLWLPRGGIYALVSAIERLARELEVRIFTNCRVERIVIENRQVTGIQLANGERIAATIIISNVDVPTTNNELLERQSLSEKERRRTVKMKMTPGVLTFYWGISGKIEGLRHHTIFLPQDYRRSFKQLLTEKRLPDDMPFYVSMPSETDSALAPVGDTAMFVLIPTLLLSELNGASWDEIVPDVRNRVLERFRQSGVKLPAQRIIFEEVYTPKDWQQRFGLYDGSAFGATHSLFQVGPWRAPNYAKAIRGLYYVGASTTPGTGMPMVVLGGKMVAERVKEQSGVWSLTNVK